MAAHDESGRGVLESGFRILRALPDADDRRQISSLAELTSIPRSTSTGVASAARERGGRVARRRPPGGTAARA